MESTRSSQPPTGRSRDQGSTALIDEPVRTVSPPPARAPIAEPIAPAPPSTAPTSAPAAPSAANGGRRRLVLGIVSAIVLALLVLGARSYVFGLNHVSTDNAQVEGHIIPVLPKVSGYVATVNVVENQSVRSGQTLVTIDDRDFRARLAQAEGDLQKEIASAGRDGHGGQASAQLAAARAMVAQTEARSKQAQSDVERYRTLAASNVVSQQQLESAEATATAERASVAAARDQVTAASAGLTSAQARVVAAQAARDQAALQLGYTVLAAPTTGEVSKKNVEVGQLVQAGQPLLSVVPLDDVWIVANLKETEIKDVSPGDRVTIDVDAYPGHPFKGRVVSLAAATGARFSLLPPDNATGNFTKVVQRVPVKIVLDEPRDSRRPLRPGMSAHVTIATR